MRVGSILWAVGLGCLVLFIIGEPGVGGDKGSGERADNAGSSGSYDGDTRLRLQPAYGLWKRYDPDAAKYAFSASDAVGAKRWQRKTRKALSELIGFQDVPKIDPQPRLLEEVDKGEYIRQKLLVRTSGDTVMPVYILLPKGFARPLPVVVAFNGHGYGVKSIVGIRKDGTDRDEPEGYQKDFAVALCRRGFAVAAPEISCFGERVTDFSYVDKELGQGAPGTCKHTSALAAHLGGTVLGLRVLDAHRLIDYLGGREEMDMSRLGVMGISGGGMLTFFTTALDERVKACVVSGYFCTFRDSILALGHCRCNFVPGLARFGEMSDISGLIAPRPMLVEAGSLDPIFPIRVVKKSVCKAEEIYAVFGAEGELETDYFEGKHQISGKRAYDFLMEKLHD